MLMRVHVQRNHLHVHAHAHVHVHAHAHVHGPAPGPGHGHGHVPTCPSRSGRVASAKAPLKAKRGGLSPSDAQLTWLGLGSRLGLMSGLGSGLPRMRSSPSWG